MANRYGMDQGNYTCPSCGFQMSAAPYYGFQPGFAPSFAPGWGWGFPNWGLGGLRTWGGTYSPQYTATGLPTDEEIEEMVYDALDDDPIVPYDAPIDVDVAAGVVTLTGTVPNKRVKHAAGTDAWWIPGVVDVVNSLELSGRRRARSAPIEHQTTPTKGR
ncbi:MAG: BON domain-containing protein [Chloroflexi bacterium]|nr:BON domain-containing protein [Chloroflexota bacterium]